MESVLAKLPFAKPNNQYSTCICLKTDWWRGAASKGRSRTYCECPYIFRSPPSIHFHFKVLSTERLNFSKKLGIFQFTMPLHVMFSAQPHYFKRLRVIFVMCLCILFTASFTISSFYLSVPYKLSELVPHFLLQYLSLPIFKASFRIKPLLIIEVITLFTNIRPAQLLF